MAETKKSLKAKAPSSSAIEVLNPKASVRPPLTFSLPLPFHPFPQSDPHLLFSSRHPNSPPNRTKTMNSPSPLPSLSPSSRSPTSTSTKPSNSFNVTLPSCSNPPPTLSSSRLSTLRSLGTRRRRGFVSRRDCWFSFVGSWRRMELGCSSRGE